MPPTVEKSLREAFRFHHANSGYCTPPGRAQCALDAARAEKTARDLGLRVVWEEEDENPLDVYGDDPDTRAQVRRIREGESDLFHIYVPSPINPREWLASLGMVEIPRHGERSVRRVYEAEMYLEAIPLLRKQLEGI